MLNLDDLGRITDQLAEVGPVQLRGSREVDSEGYDVEDLAKAYPADVVAARMSAAAMDEAEREISVFVSITPHGVRVEGHFQQGAPQGQRQVVHDAVRKIRRVIEDARPVQDPGWAASYIEAVVGAVLVAVWVVTEQWRSLQGAVFSGLLLVLLALSLHAAYRPRLVKRLRKRRSRHHWLNKMSKAELDVQREGLRRDLKVGVISAFAGVVGTTLVAVFGIRGLG